MNKRSLDKMLTNDENSEFLEGKKIVGQKVF
jgi:hypothetical protein